MHVGKDIGIRHALRQGMADADPTVEVRY